MTRQTLRTLRMFMVDPTRELSAADIIIASGMLSGTLLPILIQMEEDGWLTARWEDVDAAGRGRPSLRLYRITGAGQRAYAAEQDLRGVFA